MKALALAINVLIVGNSLSYFNELPWMLEQVALSKKSSPALHVEFAGRSGLTLKEHARRKQTLAAIAKQRWDYIVLQAQSSEAVRVPEQFEEGARELVALVRQNGAKPLLVETWAPRRSEHTQREYHARYAAVAAKLRVPLVPVGTAWQEVESKGIRLFDESGVHPNVAGSYLYASVLYALIYNRSAAGATHTFDVHYAIPEFYRQSLEHDRIDADTAATIHRAAWAAVR